MLYNILTSYSDTYSFLNFFNFLTVRTGLAVITAMIIVFLIGDRFINFFSSKQITNPIRSDGPEDHLIKKIGTPTIYCWLNGEIISKMFSTLIKFNNIKAITMQELLITNTQCIPKYKRV